MELKSFLKLLVETESPTHDKAAVDRVGAMVADEARKLGAEIEIVQNAEAGNHVIARWGQGGGILLLCHMDTVFPLGTLEKMPYREADGKIFGPGVLDMKAGIVISLGAIARLTQGGANLPRPVTLLCTSDEEAGSHTSRTVIERLAKEAAMVFVLESALVDGSLKVWRKGGGTLWVKTKGRAAHAGGDHQKGRNAIEEMAHQVLAIQKLTDYEKGTTLSVGTIRGGTVSNVVPDECAVDVDCRVLYPEEWARVEAAFANLKPALDGTSIEWGGELNRPPMPFSELNKIAFEKIKAVGEKLGIEIKDGGSGGMSDANFVAPLGIPVIDGMGAVGEGYHSEREYLFADSLEERTKLLAALIAEWK